MIRKFRFLMFPCFCLFVFAFSANAQRKGRFELETDPIAFILKGYSGHIAYQFNHLRFDAGVFGLQYPAFFLGNDRFNYRSAGVGLKADYLFREGSGFFAGLQSDLTRNKVTLKATEQQVFTNGINIGIRGGYRWLFGKQSNSYRGFYLSPWIALIYDPGSAHIHIGEESFRESRFTVFPTVHIGYRF